MLTIKDDELCLEKIFNENVRDKKSIIICDEICDVTDTVKIDVNYFFRDGLSRRWSV